MIKVEYIAFTGLCFKRALWPQPGTQFLLSPWASQWSMSGQDDHLSRKTFGLQVILSGHI